MTPGSSTAQSVDFVPLAPGDTEVSVVQPPGFVAPVGLNKVSFHVTAPSFNSTNFVLAKDTMTSLPVQLGGGVQASSTNVNVTVTSGDPSKVLLSTAPDGAPAASITMVLVAGTYQTNPFFVHALGNAGTVPLTMSAAGYADAADTVTLSDLAFSFSAAGLSTTALRAVLQGGPQTYPIALAPLAGNSGPGYLSYSAVIRPGAPEIVLTIKTSDPDTLALDNPLVRVPPGSGSGSVKVTARPVSVGPAVVSLSVPDGYVASPTGRNLSVSVEGARLSFGYSAGPVGRDLETATQVSSEVAFPQPTSIMVTSSDPSRLLVSTDSKTPGQASVTFTQQGYLQPQIWLQSLADNGTATVTASSDGYQPGTATINLVPSAPVFSSGSGSQTIYTNYGEQTVNVAWTGLDIATLRPAYTTGFVRPGANLNTAVTVSDKNVIAADASVLNFGANASATLRVRPVGLGTATLSLGPGAGGTLPASGGQLVYTVSEPDLYVPDVTIGLYLQAPLQVKMASRIPAPASDLTLNVMVGFGVSLNNGGTLVTYPTSIPVVIPAGQHISRPFYVQGTALQTGWVRVNAPGLTEANASVTVVASTFVFQPAQPVSLAVGASSTLSVAPALLPLGTASPAGLAFGAGIAPVNLGVTAGNPAVVSASPASITMRPGDQQASVTVRALAAGSSTVALAPSPIYGVPNAQSTVNVTVSVH
jgi:hypothetical protein